MQPLPHDPAKIHCVQYFRRCAVPLSLLRIFDGCEANALFSVDFLRFLSLISLFVITFWWMSEATCRCLRSASDSNSNTAVSKSKTNWQSSSDIFWQDSSGFLWVSQKLQYPYIIEKKLKWTNPTIPSGATSLASQGNLESCRCRLHSLSESSLTTRTDMPFDASSPLAWMSYNKLLLPEAGSRDWPHLAHTYILVQTMQSSIFDHESMTQAIKWQFCTPNKNHRATQKTETGLYGLNPLHQQYLDNSIVTQILQSTIWRRACYKNAAFSSTKQEDSHRFSKSCFKLLKTLNCAGPMPNPWQRKKLQKSSVRSQPKLMPFRMHASAFNDKAMRTLSMSREWIGGKSRLLT